LRTGLRQVGVSGVEPIHILGPGSPAGTPRLSSSEASLFPIGAWERDAELPRQSTSWTVSRLQPHHDMTISTRPLCQHLSHWTVPGTSLFSTITLSCFATTARREPWVTRQSARVGSTVPISLPGFVTL